jgi:site-specific DNA-cytosine methylase
MNILNQIFSKFKKGINVVSLFDGIATGYLAAEKAGLKVNNYYAYEVDKHAIKIAQGNYPQIIQKGDVIGADFSEFAGMADLLIGGSPCQNLSRIGDNSGLNGKKSKLFFEFVRALKEIQPKYFLLENNATMSDENKAIISEYMGVQPILINSALLSAQNRRRLYWTNIPVEEIEDQYIELQDVLEYGTASRVKSKTVRVGGGCSGWGNRHEWDMPNPERRYTTLELERLQTLPDNYTAFVSDVQRRKCIGNGWTAEVIAHILKGLK